MRQRTALCIAACVAALGGVACDSLPGRPDEADRYRRPSEILDFATLYGTNCAGCHGADGQLGAARPLADPVYLAVVTPERVRDVVSHGVPGAGMPVFAESAGGTLTGPQIEALTAGIFTSWGDPTRVHADVLPPYRGSNGRANHGARVYAEFCASCHGADGTGGDDGGSIVDPSFLALVSDQMLRNSVIFGRPDLGMPDWRTQGKRPLTNAEIADVVAWLKAQRRPEETGTTAARNEEMTHGG